jgi:urea transport system substrate-binding protein
MHRLHPARTQPINQNWSSFIMIRRGNLKVLALAAATTFAGLSFIPAHAQSTIKVGILHSLSGTMAISETVLKDTVLMAIDELAAVC